jgi:hypothetical protein
MLVMESVTNIMNAVPTLPDIENAVEDESEHDDIPEEEEEDTDGGCYGFYAEDSYPVGQLVDAPRRH